MESPRLRTAKKFIERFATLDEAILDTLLADDYQMQFAPASINPPGPFNKQAFIAWNKGLRDVMTGFPVEAQSYYESESSNTVVVHATSLTHFRKELKDDEHDWDYRGEYVFFITMDESGERISKVFEFLDGNTAKDIFQLVATARKKKGELEAAKS